MALKGSLCISATVKKVTRDSNSRLGPLSALYDCRGRLRLQGGGRTWPYRDRPRVCVALTRVLLARTKFDTTAGRNSYGRAVLFIR